MIDLDLDGLRAYRQNLDRDKASIFVAWPIDPETRESCWQALANAADAAIALGSHPTDAQVEGVLRDCVETFNHLDTGFITTLEREDLCHRLYELGQYCGMEPSNEWVEAYREW